MLLIVQKYDETLLHKVLKEFYFRVSDDVKVKHFFMALSIEKLLNDIDKYQSFIIDRPIKLYSETPAQTVESDAQVGSSTFKEVCYKLVQILKEEEVADGDLARITTEIMEIVEESRAEALDSKTSVIQMENLDIQTLIEVFMKVRIKAQSSEDRPTLVSLNIPRMIAPVFVSIVQQDALMLMFGKIPTKAPLKEPLEALILQIQKAHPYFPVEIREEDKELFLYAQRIVHIQDGIGTRLLVRVVRQFAELLDGAVKSDSDKILLTI